MTRVPGNKLTIHITPFDIQWNCIKLCPSNRCFALEPKTKYPVGPWQTQYKYVFCEVKVTGFHTHTHTHILPHTRWQWPNRNQPFPTSILTAIIHPKVSIDAQMGVIIGRGFWSSIKIYIGENGPIPSKWHIFWQVIKCGFIFLQFPFRLALLLPHHILSA